MCIRDRFYGDENHEHMVFPGMVYISHPTEYGTLYTKKELTELSAVCREYKIPLFMDGARLIYGLVSKETDVTLQDIAKLCDVFYIGGTKAGALCGEAVVFTGNSMPKHFLTRVKQHGALLAKGRLTGVQFDALFTDDLYLEIGKNAIKTATVLKVGLKEKGYCCSLVNARFVKPLDTELLERLAENHDLYVTIEENMLTGGFGEQVLDYISGAGINVRVKNFGIADDYVEHGNVDLLRREVGLDKDTIVKQIIDEYV